MPRPCKRRRVCALPRCGCFGPTEGAPARERVCMALDEFEALRLIDLEGLTQEEAAARLGVARSTAQAIYAAARRKLARCLVEGLELRIAGGDYVLCDGAACHGPGRHRARGCPRAEHNESMEEAHEDRSDL